MNGAHAALDAVQGTKVQYYKNPGHLGSPWGNGKGWVEGVCGGPVSDARIWCHHSAMGSWKTRSPHQKKDYIVETRPIESELGLTPLSVIEEIPEILVGHEHLTLLRRGACPNFLFSTKIGLPSCLAAGLVMRLEY